MSGLTPDEKMAMFLDAVKTKDVIAVVLSPTFFEEVKQWPKSVLCLNEEQVTRKTDSTLLGAIELLYKYEGVVAYEGEVARIYGVPIFVEHIGSKFQIYHDQQETLSCVSYS
ncbi:MAG: hypothetical protein HGB11_09855 [Chlorobiales bacterium]|nr:hypothetical protein [Chlorobiales bacterium]